MLGIITRKPITRLFALFANAKSYIQAGKQDRSQRTVSPIILPLKLLEIRNFTKFTGNHLRQSLFFNKVAADLQLYQKRDSDTDVFL